MADQNDTTKFKLDLDIKEFAEGASKAQGMISKIGNSENLEGLVSGLSRVTVALAAVGVAAFAFKKALDFTLEAEQLQKVNNQFEMLSASAGVSSKELKDGLDQSAKGLVDTSDLLQTANKFLIEMGASAKKLPEVMEVARKATSVYGGDLKANFEQISQAITTGNTRMLRQLGIVVDADKAVREYAKANGLAANEISEAGKRQAILNETLALGKKQFAGMDENLDSATNSLRAIKVAFGEIGEVIVLVFDKYIGPYIRKFLNELKFVVNYWKNFIQGVAGDLQKSSQDAQKASDDMLAKNIVNTQAQAENQVKYMQDMSKLRADFLKEEAANLQSLEQLEQNLNAQNELAEQAHQDRVRAIKTQANLDDIQRALLMDQEDARFQEEQLRRERDLSDARVKMLDAYQKNSKDTYDGISRAFQADIVRQKAEITNAGKQGQKAYTALKSAGVGTFDAIGKAMVTNGNVGAAVADVLRKAFLGYLGDRAQTAGEVMLLEGIWPPNPAAIAGGGALIALGGALKAMAGGGGSDTPSASAGGGGGQQGPSSPATAQSFNQQQQREERRVSINIAGNYFETDSTRRQLMEIVRAETDATDFTYNKIGI